MLDEHTENSQSTLEKRKKDKIMWFNLKTCSKRFYANSCPSFYQHKSEKNKPDVNNITLNVM